MYSKTVEFKDLNQRPRKVRCHFNLMETEVFKLLVEFRTIMDWRKSMEEEQEERVLDAVEVVTFYTAFEEILLAAYGTPAEDGMSFTKGSRYEFAETLAFNACMMSFVTDPTETGRLLDALLPSGLKDMVEQQDANLAAAAEAAKTVDQRQEIERLRAQLRAAEGSGEATVTPIS